MKVATPAKTHPMANIAGSGAAPMAKAVALRTGNTDNISGMVWAQTAIALCMTQASAWTTLAHELFTMNIEQREAAIKAWRQWKSDKTKAFKSGEQQTPRMDEKDFKRIMGTATVRLSHMTKIAAAITAGMDVEAVAHHYRIKDGAVAGLSVDSLYAVALLFVKSEAGRTPDSFLVKLGKFLEARAETGIAESDLATYNKVVEFVNTLA
jgi:hypothetical protein